jgi:hypothetical protein
MLVAEPHPVTVIEEVPDDVEVEIDDRPGAITPDGMSPEVEVTLPSRKEKPRLELTDTCSLKE